MKKKTGSRIKERPGRGNSKGTSANVPAGEDPHADIPAMIQLVAPYLLEDLALYMSLQEKVNEAFCGNIFLRHQSAISPENMRRWRAYFGMLRQLTMAKREVIYDIMRIHGIDPKRPDNVPPAAPSPGHPANSEFRFVTEEEIRLATYLTKHAHTMKQPFKMESNRVTNGEKPGRKPS